MRPTHRRLPILPVLLLLGTLLSPSRGAAGPGARPPAGAAASALSNAANIPGFELLGSLGFDGPVAAVAVQGNYA